MTLFIEGIETIENLTKKAKSNNDEVLENLEEQQKLYDENKIIKQQIIYNEPKEIERNISDEKTKKTFHIIGLIFISILSVVTILCLINSVK